MHSLRSSAREVCHSPNLAWYTLSLFVFFWGAIFIYWCGLDFFSMNDPHMWEVKWWFSWLLWVFLKPPWWYCTRTERLENCNVCYQSRPSFLAANLSLTQNKMPDFCFNLQLSGTPSTTFAFFHGDLLFPETFIGSIWPYLDGNQLHLPAKKKNPRNRRLSPAFGFAQKPFAHRWATEAEKCHESMRFLTRMVKPWIHTSSFIIFYFGTMDKLCRWHHVQKHPKVYVNFYQFTFGTG